MPNNLILLLRLPQVNWQSGGIKISKKIIALYSVILLTFLGIILSSYYTDWFKKPTPNKTGKTELAIAASMPKPQMFVETETIQKKTAQVIRLQPGENTDPEYKWEFGNEGTRILIDRKDQKGWVDLVPQVKAQPEYQRASPEGQAEWIPYELSVAINEKTDPQGFEKIPNPDGSFQLIRNHNTEEEGIPEVFSEIWDVPHDPEKLLKTGIKVTYKMTKNRGIIDKNGLKEGNWKMKWQVLGIPEITRDQANILDKDNFPIKHKQYSGGEFTVDVSDFAVGENVGNFNYSENSKDKAAETVFFPEGTTGERIIDPTIAVTNIGAPWLNSRQNNVFYNGSNFFVIYTKNSTSIFAKGASTVAGLSGASEQTLKTNLASAGASWDVSLFSDTVFDLIYNGGTGSNPITLQTCTISSTTIDCSTIGSYLENALGAPSILSVTRANTSAGESGSSIWYGANIGTGLKVNVADATGNSNTFTTVTNRINVLGNYTSLNILGLADTNEVVAVGQTDPGGAGNDDIKAYGCDSAGTGCTTSTSLHGGSGSNAYTIDNIYGGMTRISDTDIRLVWVDTVATPDALMEESFNPVDGTWSNIATIESVDGNKTPAIFYDRHSGDSYAFYADSADDIYRYYKPAGGAWGSDTRVDLSEGDANTLPIVQIIETPLAASRTIPRYLTWAYLNANTTNYDVVVGSLLLTPPITLAFANAQRTGMIGECLSFTVETQNSGVALPPESSTVVRITSNSSGAKIYSDANCTTEISNGDITFSTSESSKVVYLKDLTKPPKFRYTITATRQSGDTLTTGTQAYTLYRSSLYLKFDDAQGATAQDSSSNNLDGTVSDSTNWRTSDMCISNSCLWFDGTNNDNVSVAESDLLDVLTTSSDFSIQAWVKRNGPSTANNYILAKADATNGGYKLWMDETGDLCYGIDDDTTWGLTPDDTACTDGINFDDDQWHHVIGSKTGTSKIELYVDGVLRASDQILAATATISNNNTFYVGVDRDGTSNEWLGFIDDVKLYPEAATAILAKSEYQSRGSDFRTGNALGANTQNMPNALSNGLVGYWKMDELAANSCTGGTNDSCDSSGNGNNGAWTNNTSVTTGKYGNATSFDGTNDYLNIPSSSNYDSTTGTWSGWFKTSQSVSSVYPLIMERMSVYANGLFVFLNENEASLGYQFADNSTTTVCGGSSTKTGLNDGNWHHWAIAFDGNNQAVSYIDGQVDGNCTPSGSWAFSAQPIRLGETNSGFWTDFNGQHDEVRIYNRKLSGNEVSQLYSWAPGPVGHWKMDERTSTTAADSSGRGLNGVLTGGPTWTIGKYGSGVLFDGSNDYISVTSPSLPTADFTYEMWVKPSTTASQMGLIEGRDEQFEVFMNSGGAVESWMGGATRITSTSTLTANVWTHFVIMRRGSTINIYFNGIKDASSGNYGTAINHSTCELWFGADVDNGGACNSGPASIFYSGSMDDARIYNYARTQGQIVEDMNADHPAPGSPLGTAVSYWKFDEGYSTTANDSNSSTGGSENLTVSAATAWTTAGKFNKALNGATNVRASIADNSNLDFAAAEDLSISLWFKSDSATDPTAEEYLVSKGSSVATDAIGYAIYTSTSGGNVCFGIDDDATTFPEDSVCTTTDVYDGFWHYLLAKKTGTSRLDLYIDGKPNGTADTAISATGTIENTGVFYLGDTNATDGTDEFLGDLDEVKVYRSALTDSQILLDMNRGQAQVMGATSDSSTAGNDNASTRTAQSANSEYCIPGDSATCTAPVARWNFEEGSGTNTFDTSGNGYTGAITGATYGVGKYGKGLVFNGTSNYVYTGDGIAPSPTTGFTNSAWIKVTGSAGAYRGIVSKGCCGSWGNPYAWWNLSVSNGNKIRFFVGRTSPTTTFDQAVGATTINADGVWHYVTGTYDGATIKVYVDGKLDGSKSFVSNMPSTGAQGVVIGINHDTSNEYFAGTIDDVRVYDYPRSEAQVAWDYNKGAPIGHWKMDECQGTTINNSISSSYPGTWSGSGGGNASAGTCAGTAGTAWADGASGKRNYSLDFDGSDDKVDFGDITATDELTAATWAMWIKPTAVTAAQRCIFCKMDNVNDTESSSFWGIFTSADGDGILTVELENSATGAGYDYANTPANVLTAGAWNHIIVVFNGAGATDADKLKVYINGIQRTLTFSGGTTPSVLTANARSAIIGTDVSGTIDFTGQIDDVRLYNYPVTLTQVKGIYGDGAVRYGPVTGAP